MLISKKYIYLTLIISLCISSCSNFCNNNSSFIDEDINIEDKVYYFKDSTTQLTLDEIKNTPFNIYKDNPSEINLGHSQSAYWFTFQITNTSDRLKYYMLAIENPNLDEVSIYELSGDSITKYIKTGESLSRDTREFHHRHFLCRSELYPDSTLHYYIRVMNNGDELTIPLVYQEVGKYFQKDEKQLLILGLFNGLFVMIFIFTMFLFVRLKENIYLYYSLYIGLSALFFLGGDGLLPHYIPPYLTVRIKMSFLHFSMVFLIMFTRVFYKYARNEKIYNPLFFKILIVTSIIGAIVTFLPYPYRLTTIYIGTVTAPLIFVTLIIVSVILFQREYYTSFYTAAFLFSLSAVVIYILVDYGFVVKNLFTENILRIGRTFEGILLLLAVVERFKYKEAQDILLLKEHSDKIDTQRQTLQEINLELEKLMLVADKTYNRIAIYNTEGKLEWANNRFIKGYKISSNSKDFAPYEFKMFFNLPDIEDIFRSCIKTKKAVTFETYSKSGEHGENWIHTTLSPYIDKEGNIVRLISIDTDITSIKEYERELTITKNRAEQSDKLKSAILSNLSHEIRTPLNSIVGFTHLVTNKGKSEEQRKKYQQIIQNSSFHLTKLIDDLIVISKLELDEVAVELKEWRLNDIINELYTQYNRKYKKLLGKEISLKTIKKLADDDSWVHIDPDKVIHIFSNLLDNAFKFTKQGSIIFGYNIVKKEIQFYVKDTGIGIPPDKLDFIFLQFNQAEIGLSRKYGGIGIGLSIALGLTQKLGGKMWVESKMGDGSGFYFTAPYKKIERDN